MLVERERKQRSEVKILRGINHIVTCLAYVGGKFFLSIVY